MSAETSTKVKKVKKVVKKTSAISTGSNGGISTETTTITTTSGSINGINGDDHDTINDKYIGDSITKQVYQSVPIYFGFEQGIKSEHCNKCLEHYDRRKQKKVETDNREKRV